MSPKSKQCKITEKNKKKHDKQRKRINIKNQWFGAASRIFQAHLNLGLQHRGPSTGEYRALVRGITCDHGSAGGNSPGGASRKTIGEWSYFTNNGDVT